MSVVHTITDYLNQNPGQVAVGAALLAVGLQYAVNKVRELGQLTNYALALVALPGFTTAAAAYGTSLHLTAYPAVVVVAQLVYAVLEAYKRRVVAKATLPTTQTVEDPFTEAVAEVHAPTASEY